MSSEDWLGLPGTILVDLYLRLRDEVDDSRQTLDPNDKLRAAIAMAILGLSQAQTGTITEIESRVRRLIAMTGEGSTAMNLLTLTLLQSTDNMAATLPAMREMPDVSSRAPISEPSSPPSAA